jgi:small subunit ribosomal protein S5
MSYQYGRDQRSEFTEKVVHLNRVAKVVKGGRRFSFSALVVVGDQNGRVGAGLGKAGEVPEAIRKAVDSAKKHLVTVPMIGSTIPHEVRLKLGPAKILLKPAAPGTGIRSGGAMRAVVELSGVKDLITKSLGTNNPVNTVRATLAAFQSLQTPEMVAQARAKDVNTLATVARRPKAEAGNGQAVAVEAPATAPEAS